MSCHNRHTWHLPAIRGAELPWMGPNCHYDHTGPPTRHIIVSSTAEPADLSALLLSVPQPPSLCPSTFYLPCKLAGLKRSLSGPVASDLIGKLGPDHQLSPGYDRTASSVLKRPPSSHDDSPLKQGRYSAFTRYVRTSENPPGAGGHTPKYDGMQLAQPSNRNLPPIDHDVPSNQIAIEPPTFRFEGTVFMPSGELTRERIASWKQKFTDFIQTTWATSAEITITPVNINQPAERAAFTDGKSPGATRLAVPVDSNGKNYQAWNLVEQFEQLHSWLLFAHKKVWQVLNPNQCNSNHHVDENMLSWLFGELFKPTHGVPVFGETKLIDGAMKPIGKLQMWIFKLLNQEESFITTSTAIVGSWFKKNFVGWQNFFKSDHEFWQAVVQLMIKEATFQTNERNALRLTVTVGNHLASTVASSTDVTSSLIRISDDEIGNFQFIRDESTFQKLDTRNGFGWLQAIKNREVPRKTQPQRGIEIRKRCSQYFDKAVARENVVYRFPNVGIAIKAVREKSDIRILSSDQTIMRPSRAKDKLDRLVTHLETVPCGTFSLLNQNFKLRKESGYWSALHEEFLEWFGEKLFGQDMMLLGTNVHIKFPIVGEVETNQIKIHENLPYDETQLFIINFISNAKNGCRLLDSSFVIFGYWLKNQHPEVWDAYFKTDEVFSHFMLMVFERGSGKTPLPRFTYLPFEP
ncbi:hypothetical protein PCANC_18097 [Puccinia coronata f. sp. avenae]|uniref:Uncharacterized protein n=1 Tax=Puccinia coronata f. sp. avenae TaxID=200324 RepID=A0A2N5SLM6_9BASI|nr:hypothetical protein PCANC_18097 [Puccinia coronata f. sp. avenae]